MNQRAQALYVAEAGLERARAVLNVPPPAPALPALLAGSNPTYDDVPQKLDDRGQPLGVGAILNDGATPLRAISFPPASFERSTGTADNPTVAVMGTYTVWIRNDLGELRQGKWTTDDNNTVVVRSQGVANDGRTTVVLEVTMLPSSQAPNPPAPTVASGCFSGKNACDDNSSTQYDTTFGGP
jgi:hypothetical protein